MLRQFRTDPDFLLRYYQRSTLVLTLLVLGLAAFPLHRFAGGTPLWLLLLLPLLLDSVIGLGLTLLLTLTACLWLHGSELTLRSLLLLPAGVYFGMLAVQLIHNCVHQSFRPRWLNRPLGEILAVHLLSGYPGFAILHLTHHRHADDPELDPHPNGTLTFWQYFLAVKGKLRGFFVKAYLRQWGAELPDARERWARVQKHLRWNRSLRAAVLLLLVGPVGFVLFLVPSFLANHLTYAHINYFTHQGQPDGSVEIVNLDRGFYRFLNWIMLGGYSHRNHHLQPHVFNPKNIATN